jgi:hypothetical protein
VSAFPGVHPDADQKTVAADGCAHAPMGENCHACVDPQAPCACAACACFWPENVAAARATKGRAS